jgi:hypothetical protein
MGKTRMIRKRNQKRRNTFRKKGNQTLRKHRNRNRMTRKTHGGSDTSIIQWDVKINQKANGIIDDVKLNATCGNNHSIENIDVHYNNDKKEITIDSEKIDKLKKFVEDVKTDADADTFTHPETYPETSEAVAPTTANPLSAPAPEGDAASQAPAPEGDTAQAAAETPAQVAPDASDAATQSPTQVAPDAATQSPAPAQEQVSDAEATATATQPQTQPETQPQTQPETGEEKRKKEKQRLQERLQERSRITNLRNMNNIDRD